LLFLVLELDGIDLADHVSVVFREVTDASHVLGSYLIATLLNEIARRLILEEGQNEDDTSKHDVQAGRYLLNGV
jgi:hypothetical protein